MAEVEQISRALDWRRVHELLITQCEGNERLEANGARKGSEQAGRLRSQEAGASTRQQFTTASLLFINLGDIT